jgi:hypothetical protein
VPLDPGLRLLCAVARGVALTAAYGDGASLPKSGLAVGVCVAVAFMLYGDAGSPVNVVDRDRDVYEDDDDEFRRTVSCALSTDADVWGRLINGVGCDECVVATGLACCGVLVMLKSVGVPVLVVYGEDIGCLFVSVGVLVFAMYGQDIGCLLVELGGVEVLLFMYGDVRLLDALGL